MMKQRTISQRNLLGALVGGVFGILAFGYFSAILLPFGVFAGVVGGWWYQEIWTATAYGFDEGVAKTRALGIFLFTPARKLSEWRKELWEDAFDVVPVFLAWLISPFIWLLRRPAVMFMWARSHPVNRAYLVRVAILPLFYGMCAVIVGFFAFLLVRFAQGVDMNKDAIALPVMASGIFLCCMGIISIMMPMMLWSSSSENKLDEMRNFYRTWEHYSSMSATHFYVSELWHMVKVWFSCFAWVAACFTWFCGLGVVFLVVVAVTSAVIGFVKGVYQVSTQAGHWLCFGATLTTTIISATLFHGSFGDIRILWTVALLTGVFSAGLTEGLRRGFVLLFKTNRSARVVALVSLGKQLRPSFRQFWSTSDSVGTWFIKFLPTHPMMA